MGRRPKLTPELRETLLEGLSIGLTQKLASQRAGIGESTFYNWLAKGRAASTGQYRDLLDEVIRAEGQGAARLMAQISRQGMADWRAAAWILERRHPDDYGRRTELTGKAGAPVQVEGKTQHIFQPSPEVWLEMLTRRAEFEGSEDDGESSADVS